jgi:putative acetyltransferase
VIRIEEVSDDSDPVVLESTRALFRAYGDFLRNSGGHQSFRFDRLEKEIVQLPGPYKTKNGAVLAAIEESAAVGCVAYRMFSGSVDPDACEVKRLFVAADFRARGVGKLLVAEALKRACSRGYKHAYLDTDPVTMPAAHKTYLKMGFVEYEERDLDTGAGLVYLRKSLR